MKKFNGHKNLFLTLAAAMLLPGSLRAEPETDISYLSPEIFKECSLEALFAHAKAKARPYIKDPLIWGIELINAENNEKPGKGGAVMFDFVSQNLSAWYKLRMDCKGNELWEAIPSEKESPNPAAPPKNVFKDLAGLKVPMMAVLEKVFREAPHSKFDRTYIRKNEESRNLLYDFWGDYKTFEGEQGTVIDGKPTPIQVATIRVLVDAETGLIEIYRWDAVKKDYVLERAVEEPGAQARELRQKADKISDKLAPQFE